MIVDSHCHAWQVWPYQPPVPDPRHRGSVDGLLYEMDAVGIERAVIVCAGIGDNADNNDYVARAVARHRDRLDFVFDVDSVWSPLHHTPGAAKRLRDLAERYPDAVGFTHYADRRYGGWFATDDGGEFFATAAELGLVTSISAAADSLADLCAIAAAQPRLPIVLHHMGWFAEEVLACAAQPSIHLKWSGFHYATPHPWDFPHQAARPQTARLLEAFGADRLMWGSDHPASIGRTTYRQSLEMARTYTPPMDDDSRSKILGRTAARVFAHKEQVS
ncbi:amidohydrolase family protein [Streptomyces sp. NPDC004752]